MKEYILNNLTFLNRLSDEQLVSYKEFIRKKEEQLKLKEQRDKDIENAITKKWIICIACIVVFYIVLLIPFF